MFLLLVNPAKPIKPDQTIETRLHHGPILGVIDNILLSEIRSLLRGTDLTEAYKVALKISWQLQAVTKHRS